MTICSYQKLLVAEFARIWTNPQPPNSGEFGYNAKSAAGLVSTVTHTLMYLSARQEPRPPERRAPLVRMLQLEPSNRSCLFGFV